MADINRIGKIAEKTFPFDFFVIGSIS